MAKIVRTDLTDFQTPVETDDQPEVQMIAGLEVQDLEDFSKQVTVPVKMLPREDREKYPNGFVVVFRDPSHKDIEQFTKFQKQYGNEVEAIKRFAILLCTQWGEHNGVSPVQWDQMRAVITMSLAQIVGTFFQGLAPEPPPVP